MSGPSPYNALFEIFGKEWKTKNEDFQDQINFPKNSSKKRKKVAVKPSKIDNACQTHPLRDYSYNVVIKPTIKKSSQNKVKKDVTKDDTKECKRKTSSSIGTHLKKSHVNALYKTVSDIEKLFRREHRLNLHSRKCLCNSCGALGVITESLKRPVDFGDESNESEDSTEDDDDDDEDDDDEDECERYTYRLPNYNSSKRSWRIEYKDSGTIRRGPGNEGYVRLLIELERMIKRVQSLEQIALKYNIPIRRNRIDLAYDLQTNRLKNTSSRKYEVSSTSSSEIDRRKCNLFSLPEVIKRKFSKKTCEAEKQPNLRSKNYKSKQTDDSKHDATKNKYIEVDKKFRSNCLDEKIQNFDFALLNEDEICELMYHLKNKASNKEKQTNQRTITSRTIRQDYEKKIHQEHKREQIPFKAHLSPSKTIKQNCEKIKHQEHKHEQSPFKMHSSFVGSRLINNEAIHSSLRNDDMCIRKSRDYREEDTETNKMSRHLFKDYLKINSVTPLEEPEDEQQPHQNLLSRKSSLHKKSSTVFNSNRGSKSPRETGCKINANTLENDQKHDNMETPKQCKKDWINGIINKSIGAMEEKYNQETKIKDNSVKNKIGKTVTYSNLNKYHYFKDKSIDIEQDHNIPFIPIEIGQPSGLCQQRHPVVQDTSSEDFSCESDTCYKKENVNATECERIQSSQLSAVKAKNIVVNEDKIRKKNKEEDAINIYNQVNYEPTGHPLRSELRVQKQNKIYGHHDEKSGNFLTPDICNEQRNRLVQHIRSWSDDDSERESLESVINEYITPQSNKETIIISIPKKQQDRASGRSKKESIGIQVTDVNESKKVNTSSKSIQIETNGEIKKKSTKSCEANLHKSLRKNPATFKSAKETQVREEEILPKNILINVNRDTKTFQKPESKKYNTNHNITETIKKNSVSFKYDPDTKYKANTSESCDTRSHTPSENFIKKNMKETSRKSAAENKDGSKKSSGKVNFLDINKKKLLDEHLKRNRVLKDENDNRNKGYKELKNIQYKERNEFIRDSRISVCNSNDWENCSMASVNTNRGHKIIKITGKHENIIEETYECPVAHTCTSPYDLTESKMPEKKIVFKTYKRATNSSPLQLDKKNSIVINKSNKPVKGTIKKISSSLIHDIFKEKSNDAILAKILKQQKPHKNNDTTKVISSKIPKPVRYQKKKRNSNAASKIPISVHNPQKNLIAPTEKNEELRKNIFLHYNVQKSPLFQHKRTKEISTSKGNTTNTAKSKLVSRKKTLNTKIQSFNMSQIIERSKGDTNKKVTLSTLCRNKLSLNDENAAILPENKMEIKENITPPSVPISSSILKIKVGNNEPKLTDNIKMPLIDFDALNKYTEIKNDQSTKNKIVLPITLDSIITSINNSNKEETECTDEVSTVKYNISDSIDSQIEQIKPKTNTNTTDTHSILPVESDIINSYNSQIKKCKRKLAEFSYDDENSSYPTTETYFLPNDILDDKSFYASSPCITEASASSHVFSEESNDAMLIYKSKCKLGTDDSVGNSDFSTRLSESVYTSTSDLNPFKNKMKLKWLQKFGKRFKSFMRVSSKLPNDPNSLVNSNTSYSAFCGIGTANKNVPIKRKQWKSLKKLSSLSVTFTVKKKKHNRPESETKVMKSCTK